MKISLKELRQIIKEELERKQDDELTGELEDAVDQAFSDLLSSLENVKPESKKAQNEAIGLATAGAVLATPAIIKIIGKTIKTIADKAGSLMGSTKPSSASAYGAKLIEVAEELHHLYVAPIKAVVNKLFPNKPDAWKEAWANRLFHLVIAAFLVSSGTGAISALKTAATDGSAGGHLVLGTLESAMTAIKTQELWAFLAGAGKIASE